MRTVRLVLVLVLLVLPGLHAAAHPVHDLGSGKSPHRVSFARLPWAAGPHVALTIVAPSERRPTPPLVARLPLVWKSLFVPPEA